MKINSLFVEEILEEKKDEVTTKEGKYSSSFKEIFSYLLSKKNKVEFVPFVVNHMISSDVKLLRFCSMFDYYLPRLKNDMMQDFMYTILPKYDNTYFKYLNNKYTEIPKELKKEAESVGISYKNMYQYYTLLFKHK
jgi:hypothetical protein